MWDCLHPNVLLDDGKTSKGNVLIRSPGIDFHMEIISILYSKKVCAVRGCHINSFLKVCLLVLFCIGIFFFHLKISKCVHLIFSGLSAEWIQLWWLTPSKDYQIILGWPWCSVKIVAMVHSFPREACLEVSASEWRQSRITAKHHLQTSPVSTHCMCDWHSLKIPSFQCIGLMKWLKKDKREVKESNFQCQQRLKYKTTEK